MRIVLAASIYPPDIGGPAPYAAALKDALEELGHDVEVSVFSTYRHIPSGVRHLLYAFDLIRRARGKDAIIAFDVLTTGFPAAVAGVFTRVPVIARVGGDFIWESYIERTNDLLALPNFYTHRERWSGKERLFFSIVRWVLSRVHVVFSSPWVRDIWMRSYAIDAKKTSIIENAIPPKAETAEPIKKNFLMYGRQIVLKNAPVFRIAFERARQKYPDIELEEGMVAKEELEKRMRACYAVVVPSISEVSPNTIIDAIRFHKPFLLTKHSGYAERFEPYGVIVDPLDVEDMRRGIEELADETNYRGLCEKMAGFKDVRTYDDIAREFLAFLKRSHSSPSR